MKRNTGLFLIIAIASCLLLLQYIYYTSDLRRHASEKVETRNILYWTRMFDRSDFYLGVGSKIFEGCEFSNCYTTDNKSYLPVDQFDAILFHGNEYRWEDAKPKNRSQDQYYIYSNQESPVYTTKGFGPDNFFNWTMTYRSDSDIMRPYGYYKKITTNYRMPTVADVRQKPNGIVWMVSNCNPLSKRNELFEKLNEHIPIDVYGSCGTKSCPKEDFDGCYDMLARNYKFFLSFENSVCSDYVTEKLYAALMRDIVPIVYGGADYSKFAPPNSVIDVTKFDSVKELAEYLKTLLAKPEKYLSYFEWKKEYVVSRDSKSTLCSLCKKLNEPIVHKSYTSIKKWWNYDTCSIGSKLPKIIFT